MSSMTLKDIIARLPDERATIERLGGFLEESRDEDAYTVDQLYDHVGGRSVTILTRILFEMLNRGIVDSYLTIVSPSGGGIGPYASLSDIPHEVRDPYVGGVFHVSPDDVRVYWRRHGGR
jgi:hypothetical protein